MFQEAQKAQNRSVTTSLRFLFIYTFRHDFILKVFTFQNELIQNHYLNNL
jgi:hypothetical protein